MHIKPLYVDKLKTKRINIKTNAITISTFSQVIGASERYDGNISSETTPCNTFIFVIESVSIDISI